MACANGVIALGVITALFIITGIVVLSQDTKEVAGPYECPLVKMYDCRSIPFYNGLEVCCSIYCLQVTTYAIFDQYCCLGHSATCKTQIVTTVVDQTARGWGIVLIVAGCIALVATVVFSIYKRRQQYQQVE